MNSLLEEYSPLLVAFYDPCHGTLLDHHGQFILPKLCKVVRFLYLFSRFGIINATRILSFWYCPTGLFSTEANIIFPAMYRQKKWVVQSYFGAALLHLQSIVNLGLSFQNEQVQSHRLLTYFDENLHFYTLRLIVCKTFFRYDANCFQDCRHFFHACSKLKNRSVSLQSCFELFISVISEMRSDGCLLSRKVW